MGMDSATPSVLEGKVYFLCNPEQQKLLSGSIEVVSTWKISKHWLQPWRSQKRRLRQWWYSWSCDGPIVTTLIFWVWTCFFACGISTTFASQCSWLPTYRKSVSRDRRGSNCLKEASNTYRTPLWTFSHLRPYPCLRKRTGATIFRRPSKMLSCKKT